MSQKNRMSLDEYKELVAMEKPAKKKKYRNNPTEYKGIRFDSEKEMRRYTELCLMEKAGAITDLQLQKAFELQPAFYHMGRKRRAIIYVCDFFYKQNGRYIIEDVKSPVTANNKVYKLKKKMMEYRGYEIREIY